MSNHSQEFLAQYPKYYGRSYAPRVPNYTRCARAVMSGDGWQSSQCSRKNGHGPHGAWCKQHDPIVVSNRRNANADKWRAERDAEHRATEFKRQSVIAIKAIADGHNDPAALARDVISQWGPKA